MEILSIILIVLGLALFETISSIDNAIINAEVLLTMSQKARKWFMTWGLLIGVFLVRGILPFGIVWAVNRNLSPWDVVLATLSRDPRVKEAVMASSPILMIGGGTFLVLLFFHWLFIEPKNFGLRGERFFYSQGVWFYAVASVFLASIVWFSMNIEPLMAFSAVLGSTAFFITHGFKQNAQEAEKDLLTSAKSDISKILYLEIIDGTFSIDGVLGALAFTLSVPLILIGNGIGAFVVRQITIGNIDKIGKYLYLKNGAMYSILTLGMIMILHSFGFEIPDYVSPLITFGIVGYFFLKSKKALVTV